MTDAMAPGLYNMDCMEAMRLFPDNFFDLAVVDPPYGDGRGNDAGGRFGNPGSRFERYKRPADSQNVHVERERERAI